jgi:hypothetical protein
MPGSLGEPNSPNQYEKVQRWKAYTIEVARVPLGLRSVEDVSIFDDGRKGQDRFDREMGKTGDENEET